MKQGKHGIPSVSAFIPLVLRYLAHKEEITTRVILFNVADSIGLPKELRNRVYDGSRENIVEDRIHWAISLLSNADALDNVSRGVYRINELGIELSKKEDNELKRGDIEALPGHLKHQTEMKERKARNNIKSADTNNSSYDIDSEVNIIDDLVDRTENYNDEIAANLLKLIQDADSTFFEHLVIRLLIKMGYKGKNGSAIVTPKSNDGGIDGIINQDALGTNTVYLQAKRYKDENIVSRNAIEGFFGALSSKHADRGVFITTSKFSKGAVDAAKNFSIVLIDGIQLTNLMLQYHVGVQVKRHLNLFEIDEDFFED